MKCPVCNEKNLRSNKELVTHFSNKHYVPNQKRVALSVIVIVLVFIISYAINTEIFSSYEGTYKKITEIEFRESTILSNIYFYYNQNEGQLNFSFYDRNENLSHFYINLPPGVKITEFSAKDENNSIIENLTYDEPEVHSNEPYSYYVFYIQGADELLPSKKRIDMNINFSGEIKPEGLFIFSLFSNKTDSGLYNIELRFGSRECLGNCVAVLTGGYTEFLQTQEGNVLVISSSKWHKGGNTGEAIQIMLNTKDTSKYLFNLLMPVITGFIITVIFSLKW